MATPIRRPATFGGVVNPFLRGNNSAAIGGDMNEQLMPQPRPNPIPGAPPMREATAPFDTMSPDAMGAPQMAAASAMPMPQRQPGGGFMATAKGGLQDFLGGDASMAMAAGLLGGGSTMNAIGRGFAGAGQAMAGQREERAASEQLNRTADFFRSKGRDDLAEMTLAGGGSDAFKLMLDGGEAPHIEELYDQETGMPYKARWNPSTGEYERLGGIKAPTGMRLTVGPNGEIEFSEGFGKEGSKEEVAEGQREVAGNVITTAAQRAREAAKARWLGPGSSAFGAGLNPVTASAEVARQVEVLKSQAKIENLTAMRRASPTGGALGAVSDKENDMLAAKSGALDPASPTFERDLDDYELTLLQVIHGPQVGKAMFNQTRHPDRPDVPADVTPEEWDAMSNEDKALW